VEESSTEWMSLISMEGYNGVRTFQITDKIHSIEIIECVAEQWLNSGW
jgi:hypothetical protein